MNETALITKFFSQHCRGGTSTQRISKRNFTGNASWRGPNIEAGEKSGYNNVQVGGAPT
ncbi:nitrogen regulation protein NIFR3 [Staphylococcus schweitzeri]|nr:nitrogen regulation protein NIFR3 [Staphylococcus schweitzeri]